MSSKNISKVNSKDSSLAYSPNLHRKFNLKVSSQATIKSKKKKKNSEVRPYAAKKEKRVKFTKANILIPFQRCNFLSSSSSSSSSLPFLCETTTNLETSSPRTVLRPEQKLFTKIKFKKFLPSLIASYPSPAYTRITTFPFSFFPLHVSSCSQANGIIGIELKKFAKRGGERGSACYPRSVRTK